MFTLNMVEWISPEAIKNYAEAVAIVLGGSWALFQFFSLRALDKAKLELQKARRELVEHGILLIELVTESFDVDGKYFLHVQIKLRNVGSGVDVADWAKASLIARKVHRMDGDILAATDQVLKGWREPFMRVFEMRLMPGFSSSDSFLIPIPQAGLYYIEFSMPVSPAVRAETIEVIEKFGAKLNLTDLFIWGANKFVSVPQLQPNASCPESRA